MVDYGDDDGGSGRGEEADLVGGDDRLTVCSLPFRASAKGYGIACADTFSAPPTVVFTTFVCHSAVNSQDIKYISDISGAKSRKNSESKISSLARVASGLMAVLNVAAEGVLFFSLLTFATYFVTKL